MDLIINNLQIPIEKDGMDEYVKAASQKLKTGEQHISITRILSKSLDLRNQQQFFYTLSLVVTTDDSFENKDRFPHYTEPLPAERKITLTGRDL